MISNTSTNYYQSNRRGKERPLRYQSPEYYYLQRKKVGEVIGVQSGVIEKFAAVWGLQEGLKLQTTGQ